MMETAINEYLSNSLSKIFDSIVIVLGEFFFKNDGLPEYFKIFYNICLGFGASMLTAIVLFKVGQYILDESNGGSERPLGQILTNAIKGSAMVLLSPILLRLIVGEIVYPIGTYLFSTTADGFADVVSNYLVSSIFSGAFGLSKNDKSITFILAFLLILIGLGCFTFKMAVYHVDLIVLEIMSIFASISLVADDNNFYSVWWKEILSQVTTILVQTLLVGAIINLLSQDASWTNMMLIVGCCVGLIKPPSVLRNMWYSSGSGRTAGSGIKTLAKMVIAK